MTLKGLDELDRRILHELQRDARHVSSRNIADSVDASPSTVRKRIQRLESEEIITGYHAAVDYKNAGYQLFMQIECTAEIPLRRDLTEKALDVSGVVSVRELATGESNVLVGAVGTDSNDLARIARELSDLGLRVSDEDLIQRDLQRPFSEFDPAAGE
ncbi:MULTISPECIES: Lrp/AsnC family transcriptional regulator [Haloferax]|uniref:Winged helix-turn-helix transcriptional regulator n=2 Tax=Haloferax TaxID=2251 RepID=A0A6G1Z5N5_9EURY|nr:MULTISPECIES: Lrp/AsnC family transcriptional regulator [Haloferax]KAB1185312.1 Lrp/AsnC family transcriptional regulator [Haloferax sp. CBA1149]MRW81947.1 winged helix-turn-helix transcriptional regulator [Haloferax marinisediminis]